ncbi:MAG: hypothetical protein AAGI52_01625, partial [Bacteroidota bacterium]
MSPSFRLPVAFAFLVAFSGSATSQSKVPQDRLVPIDRTLSVDQATPVRAGTPVERLPAWHVVSSRTGPLDVLYDAGSVINSPGTGFGGADESIEFDLSTPSGAVGFGNQRDEGFRVADDFEIPPGETWTVEEIVFFAYQTGAPTSGTIDHVNVRIWDGRPGAPGSSVLFGDDATNRLLSSVWTGAYRVTESTFCPSGICNARAIMATTVDAGATVLTEGTYWLDWQSGGTSGLSGPWTPPVAQTSIACPTGNARQFVPLVWEVIVNSACDPGESLPFQLLGTREGGSSEEIVVDENGDAPDALSGSQDATGATDQIHGLIEAGDIADCYAITITDADAFSATTANTNEPLLLDSQLQLFTSDLEAVVFNDDTVGSSGDFLSTIPVGTLSGIASPGEFVICVTEWDVDAQNAAGEDIFDDNGREIRFPSAPNGDNVLAQWNETNVVNGGRGYRLDLTGTGSDTSTRCEDLTIALSPVTDYVVGSEGGFVRMVMEIVNDSEETCEFEAWGFSM